MSRSVATVVARTARYWYSRRAAPANRQRRTDTTPLLAAERIDLAATHTAERVPRAPSRGTAIELENTKNTGATQMAAADFLELTYPSADALQSLEAVGPGRGRPLVLIGERGQGKSHLMALLHHAFTDADATRAWLEAWSERLEDQRLAALPLRDGMHVISESLHRQRYKFLWDLCSSATRMGRRCAACGRDSATGRPRCRAPIICWNSSGASRRR